MNQFQLGFLFSRPVVEARYPEDILFVERNVYEYELAMEYAICCYWLSKHDEAIRINELIASNPNTPRNVADAALINRHESEKARISIGKAH